MSTVAELAQQKRKIHLKSWKGDYLHRPDSDQGVTSWHTGVGNEWTIEAIGDGKYALKSWKGDYLHRPDSDQGVTSWHTGVGSEWTIEPLPFGPGQIITLPAATTDLGVARPRAGGTVQMAPALNHPSGTIRVGDVAAAGDFINQYVFAFEFPVVARGTRTSSVELSLHLESVNASAGPITHNADLWITGHATDIKAAAPYQIGGADGIERGAAGADGAHLVQPKIFTPDAQPGVHTTDAAGAAALKNSIDAFFAFIDARTEPYTGGIFLVLRLNCDAPPNANGNVTSGYQVYVAGTKAPPTLTMTLARHGPNKCLAPGVGHL